MKDKLRRRTAELNELAKWTEGLENGLNEIEQDIRQDYSKVKLDNDDKALGVFERLIDNIDTLADDIQTVNNNLITIEHDISELKEPRGMH